MFLDRALDHLLGFLLTTHCQLAATAEQLRRPLALRCSHGLNDLKWTSTDQACQPFGRSLAAHHPTCSTWVFLCLPLSAGYPQCNPINEEAVQRAI